MGKVERLSNFEALRLLCMLMVLNLHSFSGYEHGSGIGQALDFFRESTSICAVDCFVLISGYFGIRWKMKSFFNLIFQIFFYSVGIYLVVTALGIVDWNTKDFTMRFACLFKDSWWFAIAYMMLFVAAPILNAFTESLTPRRLLTYILLFFIAMNFVTVNSADFFTFCLVYLIGRYLRMIRVEETAFAAGRAYWIVTTAIFVFVYFLIYHTLGIKDAKVVTDWPVGFIGYDYQAPLVLLQAVCLFIVFAQWRFSSKLINTCAASCFAIYLIHMHPTIKNIGYYGYSRSLYELPALEHIALLIMLIAGVFCGSILIDRLRIVISDGVYYLLSKNKNVILQLCTKQ